jgi:pimeloyl-ACP methyl ester carboxylesterase
MGVQVALQLAHVRPEAVRGLVLVAGTAGSPFRTMYGGSAASLLFPLVSMAVGLLLFEESTPRT